MLRLFDSRIQVVAQAIVDAELGRYFPGVLKIEVIGFAANRGFVKALTARSQANQSAHGVRIGRRGQQSCQGIGQWIAWVNVMCAAGGGMSTGEYDVPPPNV